MSDRHHDPASGPIDHRRQAALHALGMVASATAIAERLQGDVRTTLLQSVVDAAVSLFEAEAASIAVFDPDSDRLIFRVASGAQGAAVVGISVPTSQGIAGHVYSTAQAVASADVAADPRFDRDTAQRTGYLPRSLAAVPLIGEAGPLGVLQVLDKRTADAFSPDDLELLGTFARQAAAALEAPGAGAGTGRLIREAISTCSAGRLDDGAIDALTAAASDDAAESASFRVLVAEVARWQGRPQAEVALAAELLDVMAGLTGSLSAG
jgi:hypothetical protein